MKVETLLKVLDDTKKVTIIEPIYGSIKTYKSCKTVGLGFRHARVAMVTISREKENEEIISIVVKPPKAQESDTDDKG